MSTSRNNKAALLAMSNMWFREMSNYSNDLHQGFHMMVSSGVQKLTKQATFKTQTLKGAPVVILNDLETTYKNGGFTEVGVDMQHDLRGMPAATGDEVAEGKERDLTSSTFKMGVNRLRQVVKRGGTMSQLEKSYNTTELLRPALQDWGGTIQSEIVMYQLAGARGSYYNSDLNVALASHPKFNSVMTNSLMAPTYDRRFIAQDAANLGAVDANSIIDRDYIKELRYKMDTMRNPIKKISLGKAAENGVTHIIMLSPAQWKQVETTFGNEFETLIANARARTSSWDHPIFKCEGFVYKGFYFMKNYMPIRFYAGDTVNASTNVAAATETTETVAASRTVDRGLILGAEAVAMAYAGVEQGRQYRFVPEEYDGKDKLRIYLDFVFGAKKLRFEDKDGWVRDRGVAVIDSVVTP